MCPSDVHFVRPIPPPTQLPFCVRTMGRIAASPYHTTLGTFHDDAMLTVVLGGRGRYLSPNGVVPVRAGMVGLVLPGESVGVLMSDEAEPYDHLYCRFAGEEAIAIARQVADAQREAFFVHPAWEMVSDTLLRAIGWGPVYFKRDVSRLRRVDTALAEALVLLQEDLAGEAAPPVPTADRLLGYIHDHLADPTDLGVMAEHFGYSRSHLCRLAKSELGQTLQRVWEAAKIERAKALLAQPGLTVGEVAQRVGYADACYFSNVFLRVTGQRPSAYREAMR